MLLSEQFKAQGAFLFRYRSYVPLAFILLFVLALLSFKQYLIVPNTEFTSLNSGFLKLWLGGGDCK